MDGVRERGKYDGVIPRVGALSHVPFVYVPTDPPFSLLCFDQSREFCGHKLPEGLRKNDALPRNILTPTTKEKTGDRPTSLEEIREKKIVQPEVICCFIVLTYFSFSIGLILVVFLSLSPPPPQNRFWTMQ